MTKEAYVIRFKSLGNLIDDTEVVVMSTSGARALDAFWCWARLQPWYSHTWDLEVHMKNALLLDEAPVKLYV